MPEISGDIPPSADYKTLERRFGGFMGLHYFKNSIESGLPRALTLGPPYDEKHVTQANQETAEFAREREETGKRWHLTLENSGGVVIIQNEIPKPKRGFLPSVFIKPTHYSTMRKITFSVMRTFKDLGLINKRAKPIIERDWKQKAVNVGIARCQQQEKSIFHQAISEVLGAINTPKYLIVRTKNEKPDPRASFAVPEIFSNKKANAEVFHQRMAKRFKHFELYSARSNDGKKLLAEARKKAYVNKTGNEITAKMKLR